MSKINRVMEFLKKEEFVKYYKYVKYAVAAIVVVTALVFFAGNGENSDIISTNDFDNTEFEKELDAAQETAENNINNVVADEIFIDIEGQVKNPGVYKLKSDARMYEAIELAGGLLANADTGAINQAEILYDGEKITIYEIGEIENDNYQMPETVKTLGLTTNGLININEADSQSLQEIPGVGPATAEKIIEYRNLNGKFKSIEELTNVKGIGEKTLEKIKDMITV